MSGKSSSKLIILIIAISLIILGLSGCGKPNVTGTTSNGQKTPGPSVSGNNDLDFGGETIRISYWFVQPGGEGAAPFADRGQEGLKMTERINELQEKYNCKLQWVANGTCFDVWSKMHTSILTGKPDTDIAMVGIEHVVQSFEKGGLYTVLNDYADIIELDNSDYWDQDVTNQLFTIDSMTCAVQPALSGIELAYWGNVFYFNKSMLEREGVWDTNNLYEMQKNKTWTWSALDEIASKLTKDTDGDSKIDQFGMIYNARAHCALNASNSKGSEFGFYEVNSEGKPVFRGKLPAQLRMLNFLKDSGQMGKGWLYQGEAGWNVDQGPIDFFTAGHAGFLIEYGDEIETFDDLGMQDKFGVVAVPIGPDNPNNEYYLSREYYKPWIIPRNLSNTEHVSYILKDLCRPLYTPEEDDIGIEATLADVIGDEAEIIDTYKMLGKTERAANNLESPFVATWANPIASYHGSFYAIIEQGFSPEQLNDMYADQIQTSINDYWSIVLEGVNKMKTKRAEKSLT